MSDDLTTAYLLGAEQMRDKLHKQADEIERLRERLAEADECNRRVSDENEKLRFELDMQQATILVPSQKDDQRRIERLNSALAEALDEAAALRAENEKLREALKSILNDVGYHNPMRMTTEISDKILEDAAGALHDKNV